MYGGAILFWIPYIINALGILTASRLLSMTSQLAIFSDVFVLNIKEMRKINNSAKQDIAGQQWKIYVSNQYSGNYLGTLLKDNNHRFH